MGLICDLRMNLFVVVKSFGCLKVDRKGTSCGDLVKESETYEQKPSMLTIADVCVKERSIYVSAVTKGLVQFERLRKTYHIAQAT